MGIPGGYVAWPTGGYMGIPLGGISLGLSLGYAGIGGGRRPGALVPRCGTNDHCLIVRLYLRRFERPVSFSALSALSPTGFLSYLFFCDLSFVLLLRLFSNVFH